MNEEDISKPRPGECQDMIVLARDAETGEVRLFLPLPPKETPS